MPKQYDSMGQAICVGDVITHATGSGHAMNMSVGIVYALTDSGIGYEAVTTVEHGERVFDHTLSKRWLRDGKYCTITGLDGWEFEERFDVQVSKIVYPQPILTPEQVIEAAKTAKRNRLIPQIWVKTLEKHLHHQTTLLPVGLDFPPMVFEPDPGFSEALDRAEAAMAAESDFIVSILGNDPIADFVKEQWEGTGYEASASLDFEY